MTEEHPRVRVALDHDRIVVLHGSCKTIGDVLAPNSIDAIVTDPPAGIAFMGKSWDKNRGGRDKWIAWLADLFGAAYTALKPGGHALVWAIPRTSHWTATAIEDSGFEIRDVHHHLFGSGFPKSLTPASAPIPEGAGTAWKPAVEHWILARKPLEGTVGENFATYGTGVMNIDETRIGNEGGTRSAPGTAPNLKNEVYGVGMGGLPIDKDAKLGRWPAHLSLEHAWPCWVEGPDDYMCPVCGEVRQSGQCDRCGTVKGRCVEGCPVKLVDEQSGTRPPKAERKGKRDKINPMPGVWPADPGGGASRFFYVAKPSRKEKDHGLEHLPMRTGGEATGRADGSAGVNNPRAGAGRTGGARNIHPTAKSIALMEWLIRTITPPGGTVLDMFAGSGTTGVAALKAGRNAVLVELTDEYLPIILGRANRAIADYCNTTTR